MAYNIFDNAIAILRNIWNSIKKFFVKLLNFARNIVSFFKNPNRMAKLKSDPNVIATSIKENLGNGNYNVVNCLFDTEEGEVVDMQEDAVGIEAEDIDAQTEQTFGDKAMIVLQ